MPSPSNHPPTPLPSEQLVRFAATMQFPTARRSILAAAKARGLSLAAINILRYFPEDEIFDCTADFTARCEELELLQREERESPKEFLRSP